MDIQHISALMDILSALGFPASTNRRLLFNACLGQKSFAIQERMLFGEDTINYQLYFKEETSSKMLICSYYDAILRKAVEIDGSIFNGIDVSDLEKRMATVNWQMLPEIIASDDFSINDKNTWKMEAVINEITRELEALTITSEGTGLANLLKYKFWSDIALQNLIPQLPALKSKYELSQRFYIINGQSITVTEAYRFLNNRWMERQIHADNRLMRQMEVEQKEAKGVTKEIIDKKKNRQRKSQIDDTISKRK